MTDRRAGDLSYGHLGEATYDLDEKRWFFSRSRELGPPFQALQPLHRSLLPSIQDPPDSGKRVSQTWYAQQQWLAKTIPDTGSVSRMLSTMNREASKDSARRSISTLLAVGVASDIDHMSGTRNLQIIAIAYGESGNLLRLIKPRVEDLGWEGYNGVKLRTLNPASSEEGYWLGEGGPIEQITFAADTERLTSWLAVRRAESTSILRPIFRRIPVPSTLPKGWTRNYPPSRLCPNVVLTLHTARTGGRRHADVTFNPWYIRQFAILDELGYWSVWDIEGQRRKRTTFEAVSGKSGHIHDDRQPESDSKTAATADGWGRLLWAGSVSTLVVFERRSFAVFSLKGQPKRLNCPTLIDPRSTDWIQDVKRSPVKLDQIFVITTTRIFWIQIKAAGEDSDETGYVGATILLSCRHFRNARDNDLKLEMLQEDKVCIVFVYCSRNELVNVYRFGFSPEGSPIAMCSDSSLIISSEEHCKDRRPTQDLLQTLCMVPATLIHNPNTSSSGPGKEFLDRGVQFYQLFALDNYLGLSVTMCSTIVSRLHTWIGIAPPEPGVTAPTIKTVRGLNAMSSRQIAEDQFVIPDGLDDGENEPELPNAMDFTSTKRRSRNNVSSLAIDAQPLFRHAFHDEAGVRSPGVSTEGSTINSYIIAVIKDIADKKSHGSQGFTLFADFSRAQYFSEDVDDISSMLVELIDTIGQDNDVTMNMNSTIVPISTASLDGGEEYHHDQVLPAMSKVYDSLVALWVGCLPRKTPGPARLAKERLVRHIATELYLSSFAVSIRDRSVDIPESVGLTESLNLILPVRRKDDTSSTQPLSDDIPGDLGIVTSSSVISSGIPTPATTPSAAGFREASAVASESTEDSAISRLRAYALSVGTQRPLDITRSNILAHWPANPGIDPSKYSWEDTRATTTENAEVNSDEEEAYSRRKEEERRRRREEKFIRRQRLNTLTALSTVSRPMQTVSGSQPDVVQPMFSSQTAVTDVPMTQPDRGTFGSRLGQKSLKKRRTRGF